MSDFGVQFKGVHSTEIELCTEPDLIERPLYPEVRKQKIEIMGRHGSYDFSGSEYRDKKVKVTFRFAEYNYDEKMFIHKYHEAAAWLRGKGELIFDDDTDKYYIAKVFSMTELKEAILIGEFTVEFECEPFQYLIENVSDIILDSEIMLLYDLRLGDAFQFEVGYNRTIEINNFGHVEVRPIITVEGSFNDLSIKCNGITFEYNSPVNSKKLIINGDEYKVTVDGGSVIGNSNGEFIELTSGVNNVTISGQNLAAQVTIDFKVLFL